MMNGTYTVTGATILPPLSPTSQRSNTLQRLQSGSKVAAWYVAPPGTQTTTPPVHPTTPTRTLKVSPIEGGQPSFGSPSPLGKSRPLGPTLAERQAALAAKVSARLEREAELKKVHSALSKAARFQQGNDVASAAVKEAAARRIQKGWHECGMRAYEQAKAKIERSNVAAEKVREDESARNQKMQHVAKAVVIQSAIRSHQARSLLVHQRLKRTHSESLAQEDRVRVKLARPPPPSWMVPPSDDEEEDTEEEEKEGNSLRGRDEQKEGHYESFDASNEFMPPDRKHPPKLHVHEIPATLNRGITALMKNELNAAMAFFSGTYDPEKLDETAYMYHLASATLSGDAEPELEVLDKMDHPGVATPAVALYVLAKLHFQHAGNRIKLIQRACMYGRDFLRAAQGLKIVPVSWTLSIQKLISSAVETRSAALAKPSQTAAEKLEAEWARDKEQEGAVSPTMDELMKLTGLAKVKQECLTIRNKVQILNQRKESLKKERFHVLFTGNPGTGKTTVARMYGQLLRELGALHADSHYEETTGSELGSGGLAMLQGLLKKFDPHGGCLCIDEAYQLEPHSSPNGKEVVNLLLTEMESQTRKLVVIFTGYADKIDKLLSFNIGFPSRFLYKFVFEDYTEKELLKIAIDKLNFQNAERDKAKERVFHYADDTDGRYIQVLIRRLSFCSGRLGFGNARAVENTLQQMRDRQVVRLAAEKHHPRSGDAHLFEFTKEDIIGPRPDAHLLESCDAWHELKGLTGLAEVKAELLSMVDALEENYNLELQNRKPRTVALNRVFLGNPGTGKTTVAKLYGRILRHLGILSKGELHEKNASDFIGSAAGHSEAATKAILDASAGSVLMIDEAYGLNPFNSSLASGGGDPYRVAAVDTLVANCHNKPGDDRCILMLGYKKDMEAMFNAANAGFKRRFGSSSIEFADFTTDELGAILRSTLKTRSLKATGAALMVALDDLEKQKFMPNFGNAGSVETLVSNAMQRRLLRLKAIDDPVKRAQLSAKNMLLPEDFRASKEPQKSIDEIFESIVGNARVKNELKMLQRSIALARQQGRADPFADIPRTFLFTGPPGTGKTTVAGLMGQLFHSIGVLGSSDVVELSASKFTTGYVGQAGLQTLTQLRLGLGKVLFIDEAYRLNPKRGGASFNGEALDELTNALTSAEFKGKMVIILAGYEAEIEELLEANPGLPSRFPTKYCFDDFTLPECFQVLEQKLGQKGLKLTDPGSCASRLAPFMSQLKQSSGWGNGRDLETLAAQVKMSVVRRVAAQDGASSTPLDQPAEDGSSIPDSRLPVSELELRAVMQATLEAKFRRSDLLASQEHAKQQEQLRRLGLGPFASADGGGETSKARESKITITQEEDEPMEEKDGPEDDDEARDAGVSDATWKQLALDKLLQKKRKAQMDAAERKKEEETQEKLKAMGVCVAGYEWIKQESGYRCAGGSHYISSEQLE